MANTTLQIRHSTVAGNTPPSLANGEIAINSKDGLLFYSTPSGIVTSFSTGPSGLDTEIQFNDAGSVGASEKLTFNKTTGQLTVSGNVRANLFSDDGIDIYDFSNRAFTTANAAFSAANNATDTYVRNHANAAFAAANGAVAVNLTQNNSITVALNTANAAFAQANNLTTITPVVFETTSNGTVTTYDIGFNPISKEAVMVTIAGIVQPVSSYSVNASANTITFSENPQNDELVRVASFYSNVSATYFQSLPAIVTPSIFEATSNGEVSSFNLGFNPGSAASLVVSIGGVLQPTSAYTVNTSAYTITFTDDAPANGEIIQVTSFYSATNAYVINDSSVSFLKLDANLSSRFVDTQNRTNAAFDAANTAVVGSSTDPFARNSANAAFASANAAFASANAINSVDVTQNNNITVALNTANAAFLAANNALDIWVRGQANAAFTAANSAGVYANAAFLAANNAVDPYVRNHANSSFIQANAAFNKANSLVLTRTTVTTTTASLAANTSANATVTIAKGYVLYKIAVSTGAWVTLYSNTSLANADYSRSITVDPNPGSGVIAESITTGTAANVTYYTPAVYGMNDDVSVTSNGYLKIYNNSNTTNSVSVTLTYLPLEI